MPDPFLLAHAVAPLSFDIGGRLTPISLRDQMLRGRLIVERGVEAGLIGPGRRLLVVGAGAAGATAAIRAAQRGIATVLIDSAPAPFLRQAGCSTRWVDPTQYDWPVQHWANGHYPWTLPRMPLPWREDYAANLAAAWTHQLSIARGRYPHFHARFNTTLGRPPTLVGTVLRVTFSPPGLPPDYGMLVSGTGFGTENCTVDNSPGGTGSGRYAGFRFWDTDDFARPNLNIPSPAHAEVLISGGGDGALQDCLRIMTQGLSAKQIYQQLYNPATTGPLPAWIELEQTIQSAEDQAQRAYIWGERRHDHAVHHRLHRAHQRAIAQLLSHSSIQSHLWSVLQSLIKAPQPGITLAHPCTHFSQCYGLNRFLVLLFAAYLAHTPPGSNPLRLNTSVQYVDCHHPPP